MAARTCWQCQNRTHMTRQAVPVVLRRFATEVQDGIVSAMYLCDECRAPSLGMARVPVVGYGSDDLGRMLDGSNVDWIPRNPIGRDFPEVPEHIASAASEAYECLSIGADRGAASLARAVVEAVAKDQGITSGLLVRKIEQMEERRIVRPGIADAAHEVRHLGNDMAHGDFAEPVAHEDAELVLELMAAILDEVYTIPAKVRAQREKREAAKAERSSGAP